MDYFLRFTERFPDVASLASAEEDEVLKYCRGLVIIVAPVTCMLRQKILWNVSVGNFLNAMRM